MPPMSESHADRTDDDRMFRLYIAHFSFRFVFVDDREHAEIIVRFPCGDGSRFDGRIVPRKKKTAYAVFEKSKAHFRRRDRIAERLSVRAVRVHNAIVMQGTARSKARLGFVLCSDKSGEEKR